MFGRAGKRQGAAAAAPQAGAKPPPHTLDATEGFPRGLPDGDRRKPAADSRWPSREEIAALLSEWRPGMFLLGRDETGRYYGHADDRHILTVAGSRAGKGVSLIVPNLLHWLGSAVVIDPKGELATLTASRRSADGSPWAVPLTPGAGEVYALDPFGRVTGDARKYTSAGFNPMAEIDVGMDEGFDRCSQLADALVIQSTGEGAHWTQGARTLLCVLIYYVAATKPPAEKNLVTVRRLLTAGPAVQKGLWQEMAGSKDLYLAVNGAALAAQAESARPGELQSVIASAVTQTAFLEGPQMARVLSSSSLRLEDLKAKRITVYLCLPSMRLATHGRWLRLVVGMAMDAMERTGPLREGQHRVLFCLDEFAALGTMETVEKAAGQIASFGVKLWPIIQDLPQLQRDYRDGWETFMGNAGLLTFFGNTDLTSTEHIAKRLGETEITRVVAGATDSWSQQQGGSNVDPILGPLGGTPGANTASNFTKGGGRSENEQWQTVALMQPSEVVRAFARETGKLLVLIPGKPPVALHRCVHHSLEDDGLCGGLFDPIEGQASPRTNRLQREKRDGTAAR